MSRTAVSLREATADDAHFLAELWPDVLRRADRQEQVADLELIIKNAAESAEQRLVVAEYDGEPAGATLMRVDTMSPRSEEHTSELQSRQYLVCRLLLEKKKTQSSNSP